MAKQKSSFGDSVNGGTGTGEIQIPAYEPTIANNHENISEKVKEGFSALNSKFDDTLGMVGNVLKEFRNTLTEEEINAEDRKVRTAREDKFFAAMDNLNSNMSEISKAISDLVKAVDAKNEEQDQALISMNKSTSTALSNTKNELNNTKNELNNSLDSSKDELNKLIEDAKTEIANAKTELTALLPIGSVISIPFNLKNANWTGLENTWLRCDGQIIPSDEKYNKLRELLRGTFHDTTLNLRDIPSYDDYILTRLSRLNIPEGEKCTILAMSWEDYFKFWKDSNNRSIFGQDHDLLDRLKFLENKDSYFVKTKWELRFNGNGTTPLLIVDGKNISLNKGNEIFIRINTNSTDENKKEYKFWIVSKSSSNLISTTDSAGAQIAHKPSTEFGKLFPSVKGVNTTSSIPTSDSSGLIESLDCRAHIEIWYKNSSSSIGGNYGGVCTPNMCTDRSTLLSSGKESFKGGGLELDFSIMYNLGLVEEGFDYMTINVLSMDWYIKYL